MAEFRPPDPQPLPAALLDRTTVAAPPQRCSTAGFSELSVDARESMAPESWRLRVREGIAASLGPGFVRTPVS
jgi:hypothetical protein